MFHNVVYLLQIDFWREVVWILQRQIHVLKILIECFYELTNVLGRINNLKILFVNFSSLVHEYEGDYWI